MVQEKEIKLIIEKLNKYIGLINDKSNLQSKMIDSLIKSIEKSEKNFKYLFESEENHQRQLEVLNKIVNLLSSEIKKGKK